MKEKAEVILVNELDEEIGRMEKMEAHYQGLLHRAFSVFIFNNKGEMLIQQRATNKYHSGGCWTNTCCSHPFPGEATSSAASRRLFEEMGFSVPLEKAFAFTYKTNFDNGLIEHEYDHVYIGIHEGNINPNPSEVQDYCYKKPEDIRESIVTSPHKYSEWFKIAFPKVYEFWLRGHSNMQPYPAK